MENEFFYTTIENQLRDDGTFGLLYDHFYETVDGKTAEQRAWAKLYTILAAAALSDIPFHEGILLRSDGTFLEDRVFDRRVPNPEPEEAEPVEE